jgi:hypothetical protein
MSFRKATHLKELAVDNFVRASDIAAEVIKFYHRERSHGVSGAGNVKTAESAGSPHQLRLLAAQCDLVLFTLAVGVLTARG